MPEAGERATKPGGGAPLNLGIYGQKRREERFGGTELVALFLSVVWLGAMAVFFLVIETGDVATRMDPLRFVLTLLVVFMPVALIWVGATAARSARVMREESRRLEAAIDALRHAYVTHAQSAAIAARPSKVEAKLDEIARAQREAESAIATFTTKREPPHRRPAAPPPPPAPEAEAGGQPSLALGTPAEELDEPVSVADFIASLNFPETEDDAEGFRALRRGLKDHRLAQLIRASQDVLTLLSQDGIYMDDLRPDRARPEIWRSFAQGARGRAVAALGGVRDRTSLALSASRMRQDTVFRDAVHHFLRLFDKTFAEFEKTASDADIVALADTRTARAFMLLGRVTGTFD